MEIQTRVAGVTFDGRQDVLRLIPSADAVCVWHDAGNAADPNAVAVLCSWRGQWWQAGYLPREDAVIVAEALDAGAQVRVRHWHIAGGDGGPLGMRVWLEWQ